ncbi:MAG TPA: methyltransferase [Steroidobacteraceae bacterium]|nr:methyltransferase [Steroidobacteraceae bacterium]
MAHGSPQNGGSHDLRAATASLITGCWSTQVIHAAVALGIPDRFGPGPTSSAEIARAAGTHPRATFRLLRAMATLGLCSDLGDSRFELTEAGRFLRSDSAHSLVALARHWGTRTWTALAHLTETVMSGAHWANGGREGFLSMAQRPQEAAILNRSMVEQTLQMADAIADAYDFSGLHRVLDVGGGYGALLSVLLRRYPHLQGATADLAYMEAEATAFLKSSGIAERARFIPTDFFDSVSPGADCYLLKYIIHDWDDADCVTILRNIRAAASAATVLIIERIVPEHITSTPAAGNVICGDINMMVATGGLERTESEYRQLLQTAGLELTRVIATRSPFSIIEARSGAPAR